MKGLTYSTIILLFLFSVFIAVNTSTAQSLVTADFNEDGIADLLWGYSTGTTGILVIACGNPTAIFTQPDRNTLPFAEGTAIYLLQSPDFTAAGDFNADGHFDLLVGSKGNATLLLLAGKGDGSFAQPIAKELPGPLTALVSGEINRADGLEDFVAGISGSAVRPEVLVFESPRGAFYADAESFSLKHEPAAITLGKLDDDHWYDAAVTDGSKVLLIHGRDRKLSLDSTQRTSVRSPETEISKLLDQIQVPNTKSVLQMRLNRDAIPDLAIMNSHATEPRFILSSPSSVFIVNSDQDTSDAIPGDGICDSGSDICTLRAAIEEANASVGVDTIDFAIPVDPDVVPSIVPSTELPGITESLTLDGTTQPAGKVHLSGALSSGNGILLQSSNNVVRGMVLTEFTTGITVQEGSNNILEGNFIGTDTTGTLSAGNVFGIRISSEGNHIGGTTPASRNLISGNAEDGVRVFSTNATVQGNYIGTDITGSQPLGNGGSGIQASGAGNLIGGTTPGSGNVISSNFLSGITIGGAGSLVQGNLIGLDVSGTLPLGNVPIGVDSRGPDLTIGGTVPSARNIVSDNNHGIAISPAIFEHPAGTIVQGNYVGTDITGTLAIGNGQGVSLRGNFAIVGGVVPGAGNLISANSVGVEITTFYTSDIVENTQIQGNLIGTDATGMMALGNFSDGILINSDSGPSVSNNIIGGTDSGSSNVISGNAAYGISIIGPDADNMQIIGNLIGTDVSGTQILGNGSGGIYVEGANDTHLGSEIGSPNIISGNNGHGIYLTGSGFFTLVKNNWIGIDSNGSGALANSGNGIYIDNAFRTVIGGTDPGAGNVVSGNTGSGIRSDFGNATIQGNFIGTNVSGTAAVGNGESGVVLSAGTIGADVPGGRNVISGNAFAGLELQFNPDVPMEVLGNYIGTDVSGTELLGNGSDGIIADGFHISIGGTDAASANVIAGNGQNGILSSNNPKILSNRIFLNGTLGIDVSGDGVTPNDFDEFDSVQNFPVLLEAVSQDAGTVVNGTLNSTADSSFRIDFFFNSECDPSLHGEGETWIDSTTVLTDSGGNASFSVTLPVLPAGGYITAATTGEFFGTSEFSECIEVVADEPCPQLVIEPPTLPAGQLGSPYNQTVSVTGGTPPYTFTIADGNLPAGLILNSNTGEISGTPLSNGSFTFTISVVDASGCSASREYTISVCLFCDDFEDGILATDWTYSKPVWSESEGVLTGTVSRRPTAFAVADPAFDGCSNCTMETSMSTDGGALNKVSFLTWFQDKENLVEVLMKEETDRWILRQRANNTIVAKTKVLSPIDANTFYVVKLTFDGLNFVLSIDGEVVATLAKAPGTSPFGTAGFQVKNATGRFAYIQID